MKNKHFLDGAYVFIVTKPLQLMVVMGLVKQLGHGGNKELIIADSFDRAYLVAQEVEKLDSDWSKVTFVPSVKKAFQVAARTECSKLFIDSDVGFKRYVRLASLKIISPRLVISVYEEGVGTYRNDLYSGWKKILLRLLGVGTYFGGSLFTTYIYVYDREEYNKKIVDCNAEVVSLETTIGSLIISRRDEISRIFGIGESGLGIALTDGRAQCFVYLSDWSIDTRVIRALSHAEGVKIIKPHPHIKEKIDIGPVGFRLVRAAIPAELLVLWASESFERVTVYHHGSSVERYMSKDNLLFVNINEGGF